MSYVFERERVRELYVLESCAVTIAVTGDEHRDITGYLGCGEIDTENAGEIKS